MKRTIYVLILAIAVGCLAGCASGPMFREMKTSILPLSPEKGRIFFYRITALGAAIQPKVRLNGEVVGTAKPRGFFYMDEPPGNYEVVTKTEVNRKLSLILAKGQTRYVRLNISMGFVVGHVYPELVDESVGEKELIKCKYTGNR